MKGRRILIIFSLIAFLVALPILNFATVSADGLSDNINDLMQNIDFSEFENFFTKVDSPNNQSFLDNVYSILNGQYNLNFDNIFNYVTNVFFSNVKDSIPALIGVVAIAIMCGLLQSFKSSFVSSGTANIIHYVCFLGVILLLGTEIIKYYQNAKIIIENMAKFTQIMSPIMLTLMASAGGVVSASVYSPAVVFLSNGVINIVLIVILPLVAITCVFSVISNFSSSLKLSKFTDFTISLIKWIFGIIFTVFSLFLGVQGITSATYDGISIKATKYAISNSIPIVGGFLKDGFDLVVAGSVLIKNSIGLVSVFWIFYMILSPVLQMGVFSLLLKLVSAIIEPFSEPKIVNFCQTISKTITYLTASVLLVGFMFFITILLIIFSANAFI